MPDPESFSRAVRSVSTGLGAFVSAAAVLSPAGCSLAESDAAGRDAEGVATEFRPGSTSAGGGCSGPFATRAKPPPKMIARQTNPAIVNLGAVFILFGKFRICQRIGQTCSEKTIVRRRSIWRCRGDRSRSFRRGVPARRRAACDQGVRILAANKLSGRLQFRSRRTGKGS